MKWTDLPLGEDAPNEVHAVVEIPKGSKNKYEYQPAWDVLTLDRVLPGPLQFPTAYGFIPQTIGADGDAVDVLIVQDEPVAPGIVMKVRPIGMFSMSWQESEKTDDKIIAVSANDPLYEQCTSTEGLPRHFLREIDYFFRSYLDLADPGISTDWGDAVTARRVIEEGHATWRERPDAR